MPASVIHVGFVNADHEQNARVDRFVVRNRNFPVVLQEDHKGPLQRGHQIAFIVGQRKLRADPFELFRFGDLSVVGIEDPRSAMARPTMKMNMDARNHPQTRPTGPAGMEYARVLAIEGSRPMMEKAIPKISKRVKLRRSSCLYPSLAT